MMRHIVTLILAVAVVCFTRAAKYHGELSRAFHDLWIGGGGVVVFEPGYYDFSDQQGIAVRRTGDAEFTARGKNTPDTYKVDETQRMYCVSNSLDMECSRLDGEAPGKEE